MPDEFQWAQASFWMSIAFVMVSSPLMPNGNAGSPLWILGELHLPPFLCSYFR